jgi:hypothetical protein
MVSLADLDKSTAEYWHNKTITCYDNAAVRNHSQNLTWELFGRR